MRSVILAIILLAAFAWAILARETRAGEPDVPAWGKAYHTCGTFGATDDDCDPPKSGSLYAFCDTDWPEVCNQKVLMLKDACEQTVELYGGGDPRFSCAVVDDATRDAYLETLDPDMRERTVEAWAAGR